MPQGRSCTVGCQAAIRDVPAAQGHAAALWRRSRGSASALSEHLQQRHGFERRDAPFLTKSAPGGTSHWASAGKGPRRGAGASTASEICAPGTSTGSVVGGTGLLRPARRCRSRPGPGPQRRSDGRPRRVLHRAKQQRVSRRPHACSRSAPRHSANGRRGTTRRPGSSLSRPVGARGKRSFPLASTMLTGSAA
jgi:hypothetical protein